MEGVQIDRRGVVHDGGVVLTGEDVAGPAHVRGELIDVVDAAHDLRYDGGIPEVRLDELVNGGCRELVLLHVDASDPMPFGPEPPNQVAADEPTGAIHK